MKTRQKYAALIALALNHRADNLFMNKAKNTPLSKLNMMWFFSDFTVRNAVIPGFDDAIHVLSNPQMFTAEFAERYVKTGYAYLRPKDNVNSFDCFFWSVYVRDCIAKFIGKDNINRYIPKREAADILAIARRVRKQGPTYDEWMEQIKRDSMYAHEVTYSGLFDVKMSMDYDGKIYLYSYGNDAVANCIAFRMRMGWTRLCANTI